MTLHVQDLLTRHKAVVALYLQENYQTVRDVGLHARLLACILTARLLALHSYSMLAYLVLRCSDGRRETQKYAVRVTILWDTRWIFSLCAVVLDREEKYAARVTQNRAPFAAVLGREMKKALPV
eukprot:1160603-Pelagomonas_calceolata.AAC.7